MRYYVEWLPNGFISIYDRRTGLRGLYTRDGAQRSGGLWLPPATARQLIGGAS